MKQPEMWDQPVYYWCTRHHVVEGADGCPNAFRLGPFDSEPAAARAMELARERTEQWEAEEREEAGDPPEPR